MRVIAGRAKGHKFYLPKSYSMVRPITDRAKTALFDILNPHLFDVHFLDLYAGIGNVGIEALSRGAATTTFVERSNQVIKILRQNLITTQLISQAVLVQKDSNHFLSCTTTQYDIIFLAPPQFRQLWIETISAIDKNPHCLTQNSQVIVQLDPSEYIELNPRHLSQVEIRRYGNVMFVFYQSRFLHI
jgi:16S rRNA (guanine(966)-N(2))-methyltransferase RsmD